MLPFPFSFFLYISSLDWPKNSTVEWVRELIWSPRFSVELQGLRLVPAVAWHDRCNRKSRLVRAVRLEDHFSGGKTTVTSQETATCGGCFTFLQSTWRSSFWHPVECLLVHHTSHTHIFSLIWIRSFLLSYPPFLPVLSLPPSPIPTTGSQDLLKEAFCTLPWHDGCNSAQGWQDKCPIRQVSTGKEWPVDFNFCMFSLE